MAGTREGGLRQGAQRERFRASIQDAMAGIDIVELQGGNARRAAAAVLELPVLVEEHDGPPAQAIPSLTLEAEQILAPLIDEIAALRIDLEAARRRDLWIVLGAIAAAVLVLGLLIRG